MPKVYICIPVHNRIDLTLACIHSISNQTFQDYEIVIANAGSTDGTKEALLNTLKSKLVVLDIPDINFWTGSMNKAVEYVLNKCDRNDYIFTLNNDTVLSPNCLELLLKFAETKKDNVIGCLNLFFEDHKKIENSGFINMRKLFFRLQRPVFKTGQIYSNDFNELYLVDALSGKGVLFPVNAFLKNGLYNQEKLPHYHADTEFTQRLTASGFKCLIFTRSHLYSHVMQTGLGTMDRNFITFVKGFFSQRSALQIKSNVNYAKLVYRRAWLLYLIPLYVFIILGYLKRLFIPKTKKIA